MVPSSRDECLVLDARDALAAWRARFDLTDGLVYLDGNSLGALPRGAGEALEKVVGVEWGRGLVRSWNEAGWMEAPTRIGDKIGSLVGAAPGQVLVCDSTSVNLFKGVNLALDLRPGRRTILTEAGNFPTDRYIAAGVTRLRDAHVESVDRAALAEAFGDETALLYLTHVDFTTGEVHDMAALTAAAHEAGALVLWDLSHSAGAVEVALDGCGVDLAVGCGYKYLNGGPGAPAYLYVAERLQDHAHTPIPGWMGHEDPFAFAPDYAPARSMRRFLAGTPPIVALATLEVAVDMWCECGAAPAAAKSRALTSLFIELVDARLGGWDIEVASPRDAEKRGAQVALRAEHGYALMRALIERGVIGDFRPPDMMRFGFPALYTRHVDAWDAVETLRDVLDTEVWRDPRYAERLPVT